MFKRSALAIFLFALLGLPLLFLWAPSGANIDDPAMGSLYRSLVVLLSEKTARFLLCSAWLVVDGTIVWKILFGTRSSEDVGSIDGLGD